MITLHTIAPTTRRALFCCVAVVDILTRAMFVNLDADMVTFANKAVATDMVAIEGASGVAVPLVVLPFVLSPIAYILGQLLVRAEANYLRLVSAGFIVGSFLAYTPNQALSLLLAVFAYLILASGMIRQPHQTPS